MSKHQNNGKCPQCAKIFDRYPGFHLALRFWFEDFQSKHPEAHISCAGRGEIDQEAALIKKASKAHWKESSHNWNAAIDLFEMAGEKIGDIYEVKWFFEVLFPNLPDWLKWYGAPGSKFKELPHVEVANWKALTENGLLKLVE